MKSKNYDDMPVLGSIGGVVLCVMFNIGAIFLFIDGLGIDPVIDIIFKKEYKILGSLGFLALVYFYYAYKGRYKKIIAHYEKKEEGRIKIHPVIVIFLYYGISAFLIFLAGFFKNKVWIFAQ